MAVSRSVKNNLSAVERIFPALMHWSRLPGIISFAGVLLGTWFAFLLPFHTAAVLSSRHSIGNHVAAVSFAACLAIAGILVRTRVARFGAFCAFAFLVCCLHRAKQVDVYECLRRTGTEMGTMTVTGKVCSAPLPYYENFHFLLRVETIDGGPLVQQLRGLTLNCICPHEPPLYGSVAVRGVFSPPELRRNPFEYDEYSARMAQGIWGSLTAHSCETLSVHYTLFERFAAAARAIAVETLRKVRNFDNRSLLQASFLGDTEFLSPFVKDTFRKAGIYHLIAISGLNTAMLTAALYFFLRLFPLGRTAPHLICVVALWAYLPFVGMIPSLFRATIMATLVIAALLFEKKNYGLHTLGLAGAFWLTLSPESLFSPGYQLSFAATAGLFLLFPVLNGFTPRPGNAATAKIVSFLFQSLFISIASFLATVLILLYQFGTVSYFGLVANLFAVSAMTVAMWAFFAGLFLQMTVPFLAAIPLWVAERFLHAVVWTGGLSNHVSWSQVSYPSPWPETIVVVTIALAGLAAVNPDFLKRYILFAGLGLAFFIPADHYVHSTREEVNAVGFSIPKISATAIRWPGGKHWLILAGARRVTPWALRAHILPWLRHTGGDRFDVLLVPADDPGDTTALRTGLPALSNTAIVLFPPSPVSFYIPEKRYTCAVVKNDTGTSVVIDAHGAKTAILLEENGRNHGDKGVKRASPDRSRSALVLRFRGRSIIATDAVPADHPLCFNK
jgi:ComEC/Rec2-related protein